MLLQQELPFLWPDQNGIVNANNTHRARSSELPLQRSRLWPRVVVVKASRLMRSQSLLWWLSSKNWGVIGFGAIRLSLFETWLSAQLDTCDYGVISVREILHDAGADLRLEPDEVKRLLLHATRDGGRFRADDGMITIGG